MGTTVHLSPDLAAFAQASVLSCRYNNVSEVVRATLRLLQESEARRAAFVGSLEAVFAEGDRDGFVTGGAMEDDMRAAINAVGLLAE